MHVPMERVFKRLFAHENFAYCVRDILWRVRWEILAGVTLQQGFSTRLSAPDLHSIRAYTRC